MKKGNMYRSLITILIMAALVIAVSGCTKSSSPTEITPNPFTTVWSPVGADHMVTISGDSAGHFVGEESYFTLKLAI